MIMVIVVTIIVINKTITIIIINIIVVFVNYTHRIANRPINQLVPNACSVFLKDRSGQTTAKFLMYFLKNF